MKQSKLFTKTRKEAPKDEVAKNAQLLIRAGFINKELAGVYSYLPLGLIVLNKINNIIREEMNAIGGQELFLTTLQDKNIWEKTGRLSDEVVNNWFKTKLKNGGEVPMAFTHEEPITNLMRNHLHSFRDLPVFTYQLQTKFRNEERAKSGIMRGREFLMKDLYSFCRDVEEHNRFYEDAKQAYFKIFKRVGLGEKTYLTFASGGVFSKFSHEFQTLSVAGEDLIYVCDQCHLAVNKEVLTEQPTCPGCGNKDLREEKSIEVGNIFTLGEKFSEPLGLTYINEKGEKQNVFMGSYGIGPGRLMGTIVELFADEKGLVWPEAVTPFKVHLLQIGVSAKVKEKAEALYEDLKQQGVAVLYDDRELRPGEKFADADLLGLPWRIIISEKALEAGLFEVKARTVEKAEVIKEKELVSFLTKK